MYGTERGSMASGTSRAGGRGGQRSRPLEVSATYAADYPIADARQATREFLAETAPIFAVDLPLTDDDAGMAQLVVSELVTNAHKYAPGPSRLILTRTPDSFQVAVEDTNADLPRPRGADPWRVGQHGLEIVVAVCRTLDVRREAVGKRVTAVLDLTGDHAA